MCSLLCCFACLCSLVVFLCIGFVSLCGCAAAVVVPLLIFCSSFVFIWATILRVDHIISKWWLCPYDTWNSYPECYTALILGKHFKVIEFKLSCSCWDKCCICFREEKRKSRLRGIFFGGGGYLPLMLLKHSVCSVWLQTIPFKLPTLFHREVAAPLQGLRLHVWRLFEVFHSCPAIAHHDSGMHHGDYGRVSLLQIFWHCVLEYTLCTRVAFRPCFPKLGDGPKAIYSKIITLFYLFY